MAQYLFLKGLNTLCIISETQTQPAGVEGLSTQYPIVQLPIDRKKRFLEVSISKVSSICIQALPFSQISLYLGIFRPVLPKLAKLWRFRHLRKEVIGKPGSSASLRWRARKDSVFQG